MQPGPPPPPRQREEPFILQKPKSYAHGLVDNFILWPYWLGRDALRLARTMRKGQPFSRDQYLGATLLALVASVFLVVGGLDLNDAPAPAAEPFRRTMALVLVGLGVALPALWMVKATACRLRELGRDRRSALFILVPGPNLVLWLLLMLGEGGVDRDVTPDWTPVVPPPDTERRDPR